MHIYGRTQPLAHQPILDALAILGRLGFAGVEICLENPDLAPERLTEDLARRVGEQAQALGLTRSVSYHKDFIHDDAMLAATKKAIRLTPAFGATVFVYAGSRPRAGEAGAWERMVARTRELVQVAEEVDVVLAQEFEPGFIVGCTADLHRLFAEVPSGHLQANLDLGHVFLCDPDPMAAIASLRGRIVHCHIENMACGVHCHLPPWEGDMDLAAYLRALDAIGYVGPLALDLYNEDYEQVGARAVSFLQACWPNQTGRATP